MKAKINFQVFIQLINCQHKKLFMKQIFNRPTGKAKSIFSWLFMFCLQPAKKILLIVLGGVALSSCFQHYYKVNSKEVVDTAVIEQLKAANKYFIFHFDEKVMGTQQLNLVNDQLEADLVALPKEHAHHTKPKLDTKNGMKAKNQANTLMEVHLYSSSNPVTSAGQTHIALPVTAINRVDVYEMDARPTRQNHILSVVGVTAASIILIGVLAYIITGGLVSLP